MKFQKNVSLKNHTTFKIGGRAKYFCEVQTRKDLTEAVLMAKKLNLPFFILGGGSNLLVSDKGFNGLVIKMQNVKCKIPRTRASSVRGRQNAKIIADAGVMLNKLLNISLEKGLSGLEWTTGIPGTVGGAVYGNAGAFNSSMAKTIKDVTVLDTKDLKIKNYNLADCQFSYRDSVFKHKKNLIVISAILQLKKGNKNKMKEKIKQYLDYKKTTQPLNYPSAGSVFKNFTPYRNEVSGAGPKELIELKKFKETGAIPAARLIEECGLKGKKIGGAEISEKHANFIVNLGQGRAEDVIKLINLAQKAVKKKFGVVLEEEIQHLGFK